MIALLNLSSWCLVMVERLFLALPRGCLQFVIVVFPDHTHLLFFVSAVVVRMQYRMHQPGFLATSIYIICLLAFHFQSTEKKHA